MRITNRDKSKSVKKGDNKYHGRNIRDSHDTRRIYYKNGIYSKRYIRSNKRENKHSYRSRSRSRPRSRKFYQGEKEKSKLRSRQRERSKSKSHKSKNYSRNPNKSKSKSRSRSSNNRQQHQEIKISLLNPFNKDSTETETNIILNKINKLESSNVIEIKPPYELIENYGNEPKIEK